MLLWLLDDIVALNLCFSLDVQILVSLQDWKAAGASLVGLHNGLTHCFPDSARTSRAVAQVNEAKGKIHGRWLKIKGHPEREREKELVASGAIQCQLPLP